MNTLVIDATMLDEWESSGVLRDYSDSALRTLYRSLVAREEHRGWLPEPDATMLAGYGAELARRARLGSERAQFMEALGGC